ncbi:phage tail protein [Enterococcus thailandicus]|uniref:phage tail protein n=1 Tax=Enterococcus thailandicus TaxID=417368 RepID=UPI00254319C8|nr:phage tail protein [Enterococcus thailandicus]MDK4351690.1 phage tail protein [Enterococcus thailandicus]
MINFIDEYGKQHSAIVECKKTKGVNGEKSLSGTIYTNNEILEGIGRGWRLQFEDENYCLTYVNPIDEGTRIVVEFDAVHEFFFDLKKSVIYSEMNGSNTADAYLRFIFNGSGYDYRLEISIPAFEKESFGMKNRLDLFKDFISSTGAEFSVSGKVVRILEQVGTNLSTIVKKGFNLNELRIEKDPGSFITYLKGYGAFVDPENESKGRLIVEYLSPLAEIYGKLEGDPIIDERYRVESNFIARLKKDVEESYGISVNIDMVDLTQAGYKYDQPHEGDYIMAINKDLEFEQQIRIMSYTTSYDTEGNVVDHDVSCGSDSLVKKQAQKDDDYRKEVQAGLEESIKNSNSAMIAANGKNKVFMGPDEPTATAIGDIWYQIDGEQTIMKYWNGYEWVPFINPDEINNAIDEVDKNAEDAKNEAEQATDSANKAVSDATHAVSVADQSKAAADEAKADAANAIANANQAKENASDALASAHTALDDLKNLDTVNLLPNSTWNSGQGTWTIGFNGRYEILPAEEDKPNSQILHGLPLTTTTQQLSNMPHPLYVESGQNYSIAFDFKEKNYTNSRAILYLRIFPEKTTSNNSANALWSQGLTHATFGIVANVDEFKRLSYSFKVPVSGWLDVIPYDNDSTGLHETFYREIMFVRSTTVPNSWSPYPGDTKIQIDNINGELLQKVSQSTFDVLNQTVANQATEISQNSEAIKLKANQTTVDELSGRVSTAESSITAIAGQIELKANQSDVDTISGKVNMVESTLTTQAGQITALNTKTDGMNTQIGSLQSSYDGLSSTVANIKGDTANLWIPSDLIEKGNNGYLSTAGIATPTTVNLYTDFFDVSKFSSMTFQVIAVATSATIRVCFYIDETETSFISRKDFDATVINNYIAEIPINAKFARFSSVNPNERGGKLLATLGASASIEEFSSLVQRIDVIQTTVNNKAEQSQVTQLADQITSVVSTLHENLVRNGDFSSGLDGYSLLGNPTTLVGTLSDIDRSSGIPKEAKNYLRISFPVSGTTEYVRYVFDNPNDYLGKKVTFSFYAKKNSSFAVDGCQVYGRATVDGNSVYSDYVRTLTNGWVHYSITLDLSSFQSGTNSITDIRLFIAVNNKATAGYVYLTALQAEVGSQVSEWGLEYLRGFGESQITQLTNLINLRVKEGDVINQINISPESILIAGNKVQITGQTYIENSVIGTAQIKDAAITDAKIGNLSANKITTGSLNAANVNIINMNASNIVTGELTGITLRSSANGSSFYVRGNELFMQKANGDHLTMDTSGIYWYNSAGDILFQSSKKLTTSDIFGTAKYNAYLAAYNETRSVTYASALKGEGGVNDYTYVAHRASKIYANRMEINTGSGTPSHLYLGTSSAEADVRIVVAGDGDISYARLRARELYGNVVSVNGATDGVQLYLQTKDEVRVKNYGSDASATSYKAVRASAFNTSSLAEYKTNIETFEKSALDIIGQSTIYSYNLKGDIETDEIGLVIGEGYSIAQEVVNGDGVSQYRMNSLSWKAIQELHEKIKDLENELAVFKSA